MAALSLPALSGDFGLSQYMDAIKKFPLLSFQEEQALATQYRDTQDTNAAHRLVTSHLRLVTKVAFGYRGYGLPLGEVISEGNIGLMQAVKKFDVARGFRLSTYAVWWIRASIQDYILRSWSLVKLGTTANQKKLFFNLRKAKSKISALEDGDLHPDQVASIAHKLDVAPQEVIEMNRRLSGDASLNVRLSDEGGASEWQDTLVDETTLAPDMMFEANQEKDNRHMALSRALNTLNERERNIFIARRLEDEAVTLESLAARFNISRERVRQIETRAYEKMEALVRSNLAIIEASPV